MLIADCVPATYGMTHPAPEYYYLEDRRPALYGELTEESVEFKAIEPPAITEDTRFLDATYTYPKTEK